MIFLRGIEAKSVGEIARWRGLKVSRVFSFLSLAMGDSDCDVKGHRIYARAEQVLQDGERFCLRNRVTVI